MNSYTDPETERIDSDILLEKGTKMANTLINMADTLNIINDCISNLNDEKIWQSTSANYIKERFQRDKESLSLVYEELKNYSKYLLKVSSKTKETTEELIKIINDMEDISLWQI